MAHFRCAKPLFPISKDCEFGRSGAGDKVFFAAREAARPLGRVVGNFAAEERQPAAALGIEPEARAQIVGLPRMAETQAAVAEQIVAAAGSAAADEVDREAVGAIYAAGLAGPSRWGR